MESIHEDGTEHFANRASSAVPGNVTIYVLRIPSLTLFYCTDGDAQSKATKGETQPVVKTGASTADADAAAVDPENAARLEMIRESRRKIEALERDRPLWEAAARERERAKAALLDRAEQVRREMKETERVRAQQAAGQEQLAREQADRDERDANAKEAARHEQEWPSRMQQECWVHEPWAAERALERYRQLSDVFDARKFGTGQPFSFEDVPWPTLRQPLSFSVEDIDWTEVETFFAAARERMCPADYSTFVEKSHRRFHPDRWRSRGVLTSVTAETARNAMEVAANTVAQALTPLWREAKGR